VSGIILIELQVLTACSEGDVMFRGFTKDTLLFFSGLKENNSRQWFESQRPWYEVHVKKPAEQLVRDMGALLQRHAPAIIADPRTNRSLFRIHRDTRFSREKTPYKTHLALWFWEGDGPRMECPGFYFHLEPEKLLLGAGLHVFPKHLIQPYRESVTDPLHGASLERAVESVKEAGDYGIGEVHFKKVPPGFSKESPQAEFLLFGGLDAFLEMPIPRELFSKSLIDFCMEHYLHMWPFHEWLLALIERDRKARASKPALR
jgi:uncharacterized protein (TIGR02453 family)